MMMSNRYDALDETALQILMDYSEGEFPLDLGYLCEKLRIKLIPYSKLEAKTMDELNEIACNGELSDGFSVILKGCDNDGYVAYTYYNDSEKEITSKERINFTIAHEIKHVIFGETDPSIVEENEANHFARILLAPTCILIVGKYTTIEEVQKKFGLTKTAALNALETKENRIARYGNSLFEHEREFIEWYLENIKMTPSDNE